MIKIEKTLLFIIVLVFLVGVASATETPQEDQSYTNDDTVVSDISTVSQDNKETIKFEEKNLMDDNPIKIGESKTQSIEKKTKDSNLKQDGIIEVHNYTELQNAVNNTSRTGVDTTIHLLQGSYNNTETITWATSGMVLTIDGNGQTINGQEQQVFYIDNGASLVLKNITITDAKAVQGGAIYNTGTLNITNSTLNNNKAEYGGSIFNNGGTLTITQSTLNNNNATDRGGAIYNDYSGTLTITNSTLNNNNATNRGGAIADYGTLTITQSTLNNNNAELYGGAIYNNGGTLTITQSTLNNNNATNGGSIFNNGGTLTLTNNNFTKNTATNKETIDLNNQQNGEFNGNSYISTDISLSEIKLSLQDEKQSFQYGEDVVLNFTIKPTNINYYKDYEQGIKDITLYINGEKNVTTKYENYTLSRLEPGKYTVYFTTCNQQSNTVTFKVMADSEITTPQDSYEYYPGINNKIPLTITDPSGEKGTINITVKEDDEYRQLSTYYNIGDGYKLPTQSLANALENLYDTPSDSYTINVTYSSGEYVVPSSTEFTLNIIKQRNTTITYDILNSTEGNVQINITVQDAIYKTPITDANIKITGDIKQNTTSGILTDNTLTPGEYKITVQYPETDDYKESNATINFIVEIDKDAKIADLEGQVENLTEKLEQANENIENLTNQLDQANNEIETLNNTISNLTTQLEDAENKISTLNSTIENITQQLEQAREEIETLNNTIKELTRPPLNTTITLNPIKSSVGSIVNLSANVKDQNGEKVSGGKVIFKVNGITLKDEYNNVLYATLTDGFATLKYKVQDVWMKNTSYVEAVYGGNENYTSSRTKSSNILNITEGIAKVSLDKLSFKVKSGETITLRAKIVDANGDNINRGKVVFKLNGKTLTDKNGKTLQAKVVNGEAMLEYTIPSIYSAKTYDLTVVYGGEGYTRSQNSGKLTITKKGVIINTDSIITTNGKTTVKATITDETGDLLVRNTSLAIKVNGKTILKGVNSTNGKIDVSFVTTLRPGMYELQIVSGENGIYKTGRMTTVLRIWSYFFIILLSTPLFFIFS